MTDYKSISNFVWHTKKFDNYHHAHCGTNQFILLWKVKEVEGKKYFHLFMKRNILVQTNKKLYTLIHYNDLHLWFLAFPKLSMISHAHLWLLLFLQISLFIYFNLGPGPIRAKNNVNKQTNLEKQNNQSWAWLIMLNFGNVKNLVHKPLIALYRSTWRLWADINSLHDSSQVK